MLVNALTDEGKEVLFLDGDKIRSTIHNDFDFSPENIKKNSLLIINLCLKNISQYDYIIVSVIAPFEETRKYARKHLGDSYIEIYVRASLKELVKRDTKGLYVKALKGKLNNLIGVDPNTPYQPPLNPSLVVNTENQTKDQSFKKILQLIQS